MVSSAVYRRYVLVLLMIILTFNYVDRVALSMVLQPIKRDLHITDTELGFLSGLAFAFFYATMGIPIARWADRGNRVAIIAGTTGLWSLMVALSGRAASFAQLVLIRVGVGIGEAGCMPPANSLIPDYFPRAERPRAMGTYLLGGSLSLILGYFLAGWLNQLFGWRVMFMLIGLPGVVLGILSWATLDEPRLSKAKGAGGEGAVSMDRAVTEVRLTGSGPSMAEVVRTLWASRTFRHLLMEFSVAYFFGYGLLQWIPAFFIRSYGFATGALGTWLALTYGLTGLIGTYWGGVWASRYAGGNERLQFRVITGALVGLALIWSALFLTSNVHVDFALLGIGVLGGATMNGPVFAAIQALVPADMRATAIAVIYLFANLIGMGLGPLSAGALSDALHPYLGAQSLRYALVLMCPGYLWAAWHQWVASKTVEYDLGTASLLERSLARSGGQC